MFWFAQDGGESMKGDPMDLRLDIERRKKYSFHEGHFDQDQGRNMGGSPDSTRDRSEEKYPKGHKKYVQLPCTVLSRLCYTWFLNMKDFCIY